MVKPQFEVTELPPRCLAIHDRGRTVATVSSLGNVDWMLRTLSQDGPRITAIRKETHFGYLFGMQIQLHMITPYTVVRQTEYELLDGGARLLLKTRSTSDDGKFSSEMKSILQADETTGRYEWQMETVLTSLSKEPVPMNRNWIEYCNIYPSKAGRCFLFTAEKEYTSIFMTDRDDVCWEFPHQHLMHYTPKIEKLNFAAGAMAGFLGEPEKNPVVILHKTPVDPDWAICDMYYDLHCGARLDGPIQPGEKLTFSYVIRYLDAAESTALAKRAQRIPVNAADYQKYHYPRFELGRNRFDRPVLIDRLDDASGFRPKPPQKVWDRETGCSGKGSLKLSNTKPEETVWTLEPPSEIPGSSRLRITAMVKTEGVEGKGIFVRLRCCCYCTQPSPHHDWLPPLESSPISGTTDGWVRIEVPELRLTADQFDYCLSIEVVLDGKGVAWLTDADVNLHAT